MCEKTWTAILWTISSLPKGKQPDGVIVENGWNKTKMKKAQSDKACKRWKVEIKG